MPDFPEVDMILARAALDAGPVAARNWGTINPPTDVAGPPCVYRIPIKRGFCEVDSWLVDYVKRTTPEKLVEFVASEIGAYRGAAS